MSTEYRNILDALTKKQVHALLPGEPYGLRAQQRMWIALKSLLEHLDQQALESVIFRRVAGEAICGGCGQQYRTHPEDDEFPWLTRACLGQLVKL